MGPDGGVGWVASLRAAAAETLHHKLSLIVCSAARLEVGSLKLLLGKDLPYYIDKGQEEQSLHQAGVEQKNHPSAVTPFQ